MKLDRQTALERIEYDEELYHEICTIFRDDAPEILSRLKSALEGEDFVTATRHAHSLKSSAANIGATELCETARAAEAALRCGNRSEIGILLPILDQELAAVLKEVSATFP